jgi:hypothetical protein
MFEVDFISNPVSDFQSINGEIYYRYLYDKPEKEFETDFYNFKNIGDLLSYHRKIIFQHFTKNAASLKT